MGILQRLLFFIVISFSMLIICNNCQLLGGRTWPRYSLDNMPKTSFSCRDKILGGYYADSETQCQMFHVCVKVSGVGIQDFRFLCPNGTAFDQEAQICADWGDIDCEAATLYYGSDNFDLYRLGSGFESKRAPYAEEEEEATFHLQRAETGDARRSKQYIVNQSTKPQQTPLFNQNQNQISLSRPNQQQFNQRPVPPPTPKPVEYKPTTTTTTTTTTTSTTAVPHRSSSNFNNYNQQQSTSNKIFEDNKITTPSYNKINNNNDFYGSSTQQQQTDYNNDEIFKGSHSSHFFNNKNNGKEDFEDEYLRKSTTTTKQPQPSVKQQPRIRQRGRGSVRAHNSNNLPTISKTTHAPSQTRLSTQQNIEDVPRVSFRSNNYRQTPTTVLQPQNNNNQADFAKQTSSPAPFEKSQKQIAEKSFTAFNGKQNQPKFYQQNPSSTTLNNVQTSTTTTAFHSPESSPNNRFNQQQPSIQQFQTTPSVAAAQPFQRITTSGNAVTSNKESFKIAVTPQYNQDQSTNYKSTTHSASTQFNNQQQFSSRNTPRQQTTSTTTHSPQQFHNRNVQDIRTTTTTTSPQTQHNNHQQGFTRQQQQLFNQDQKINFKTTTTTATPSTPYNPQQYISRNTQQQQTFSQEQRTTTVAPSTQYNLQQFSNRNTQAPQFYNTNFENKATDRTLDEFTIITTPQEVPQQRRAQARNFNVDNNRLNQFNYNQYQNSRTTSTSTTTTASPPVTSEDFKPSTYNPQNYRQQQNSSPQGFSSNQPQTTSQTTTTTTQKPVAQTKDRYQTITRTSENYTPSSVKKFSTLVPKELYNPTTFKPVALKKPFSNFGNPKLEKIEKIEKLNPNPNKFSASSYIPTTTTSTTTTSTTTAAPATQQQNQEEGDDGDDGQYHPELYEKDFYRNRVKSKPSSSDRRGDNFNSNRKSFYQQSTPVAQALTSNSDEDEFLKTAHSQNIAASGNELIVERARQAAAKINDFLSSSSSRPTSAPTKSQANSSPRPFSKAPTIPPNATTTKKPHVKNEDKDASYDYAYYDSGNTKDYNEYDIIEEFGRVKKH